jgi:hypothetical protein
MYTGRRSIYGIQSATPRLMNLQLPLAFAVCSTGFFFLSKLLLFMVHSVLNHDLAESRLMS